MRLERCKSGLSTQLKPQIKNPFLLAILLQGLATGLALASPSIYPMGVTRYDPAAAYNSDILFSAPDHKTYLIDMDGNVVHEWDAEGFPPKMLDPALVGGAKGVIGVQLSSLPAGGSGTGIVPGLPAIFRNKTVGLVDWNGKTIWLWGDHAPGGGALQHHDWDRLPNGDMLILSNITHHIPGFGNRPMLDDIIYEVNSAGKIVWSWTLSQHLNEFGFTPAELKLLRESKAADFLHTNNMQVLGPNHWEEAGDGRFAPDNIIISSRNANFTVIISHATGKIVWRIGPDYPPRNEFKPDAVPGPIDQISGQHDSHMIPEGLAGAGDILIFDNQGEAGYPPVPLALFGGSRVIEINPVTKTLVWEYSGLDSGSSTFSFYSPFISSAQRLPNGNTLIDEGIDGRFFQITPQGRIVWEYVSPYLGSFPAAQKPGVPSISNWVYRAQAVPYAWVPGNSHAQIAVTPPSNSQFRVMGSEAHP